MEDKSKPKGKYWKKEIWFSFCSAHREYNKDCKACNHGSWRNVWGSKFEGVVYKLFPKLWKWWVNK